MNYQALSTRSNTEARGVFVTGTDTDVGKTFVSAVLTKAWTADYWKPFQTGIASAQGDTETVSTLLGHPQQANAGKPPQHVLYPPISVLQAPLSPWDAARLEGIQLDVGSLRLPETSAPLIVEGAGGLYVPLDDEHMMIDLASMLGLPVVLVARSTLGTINHTLLSLRALQARQIPVLGVIMNGPPSPGNRQAIERFGGAPVIAEIPLFDEPDHRAVAQAAASIAALPALLARMQA